MIRHAAAATFPVGALPVAVIEPSLPALLVSPVASPQLPPPRFPSASLAAVLVAPVTMTADPETPRHNRSPGKTVDAVALRGSPFLPFRRDWTTATRHGKFDLIYRGCWTVLTVGGFPFRLRPQPG